MSSQGSTDTTALLAAWRRGDDAALEQALPHVYSELRRLAHRHLAGEDSGHTFESRDLVHETFLRLDGQRGFQWQNRAHFFAVAGRMMRRILIDHARRKRVRGGRQNHVELDEVDVVADLRGMDLLALDEALEQLAEADAELARIVELRFFGGLRHAEVARVLDVSVPTVQRRFRLAKAWLYRKLRAGNRDLGDPDLGERDD
ncbi:MAG: sigma-70 family RNA polymerase sigma factor [bacterium]|nr:sigma-70 family RNA polymerase sigma factor [bacterium]